METDAALLKRYAESRDAIAFTELTRRHRELVFSTARRVTRSHHDAEDVAQACFVELAKKAEGITGSVPGWLHLQATSRAIDTVRRSAVRKRREQEGRPRESTSDSLPTWEHVGPLLDQAIIQLSEELRLPLILYFLQAFSQEEISGMLKISRRTVVRRLDEGVAELRKQIGAFGITAPAGLLIAMMKDHAIVATPFALNVTLGKIAIVGFGPKTRAAKATPYLNPHAWQLWTRVVASSLLLVAATFAFRNLPPSSRSASPYDSIRGSYARYMRSGDPLAFPQKIASLSSDPYSFWCGTPELFLSWLDQRHSDWFQNDATIVMTTGSADLNAVGVYPVALNPPKFAIALSDWDEAEHLPIQAELLHGMISLQLQCERIKHTDDETIMRVQDAFFDAYRIALRTAGDNPILARSDPIIVGLYADADRKPLESILLHDLDDGGNFKQTLHGANDKDKDILRPADLSNDDIAAGLAQAASGNAEWAHLIRYRNVSEFAAAVVQVVERTNTNSLGSRGLAKYLILLRQPFSGEPFDGILYLKQQIPAAGTRAKVVPENPHSPANRVVNTFSEIADPAPILLSACEINGSFFTVTLREPWSRQIDPTTLYDLPMLLRGASMLGASAGQTHRRLGNVVALAETMTPDLESELHQLAKQYVAVVSEQQQALALDARAIHDKQVATDAVQQRKSKRQAENLNAN